MQSVMQTVITGKRKRKLSKVYNKLVNILLAIFKSTTYWGDRGSTLKQNTSTTITTRSQSACALGRHRCLSDGDL